MGVKLQCERSVSVKQILGKRQLVRVIVREIRILLLYQDCSLF